MKSYLAYILIFCSFGSAFAQVGIGNPNPEPSSILDLTSFKKGFLVPRMTGQRRKEISGPAHSLMIFDISESMFYYYDSTSSGTGDLKWTSFSPFILRDDSTFSRTVTGGSRTGADTTINFKNVYTHENVRYVGIGTTTPLNTLSVNGNVSIGDTLNTVTAPINGLYIEGQVKMNSSLTVEDTVSASVFKGLGECPVGAIIMWSGDVDASGSPDGWKLCKTGSGSYLDKNGKSHPVPDLSGKFIVGYQAADDIAKITTTKIGALKEKNYGAVRNTGGEVAHSLAELELPSHQHEASGNGATINIITSGTHQHTVSDYRMNESSSSGDYSDGDGTGGHDITRTTTTGEGGHTHAVTSFRGLTGDGDALNNDSHENRPPYYVLAYIIRVK